MCSSAFSSSTGFRRRFASGSSVNRHIEVRVRSSNCHANHLFDRLARNTMRYAIYYSPSQDDPLTRAATGWLGRSAFTGEGSPPRPAGRLSAAEIAYHTAAARRYGFHATLMAPFTLAGSEGERELIG